MPLDSRAMRRTGRRWALPVAAATAGLLSLGGCSTLSLYFHNDAYEKATTDVKDNVAKLDVAGAFKSLSSDTDSLRQTEDDAVVTALVSLRNDNLARLIDPEDGDWLASEASARARLKTLIQADMKQLIPSPTGINVPGWNDDRATLIAKSNSPNSIVNRSIAQTGAEIAANEAATAIPVFRNLAEAAFKVLQLKTPPKTDCATAEKLEDQPIPGFDESATIAYRMLARTCRESTTDAFYQQIQQDTGGVGLIAQAAQGYQDALVFKRDAQKAAEETKKKVDDLLGRIKGKDSSKASEELEALIKGLDQADAAAKLAGLEEVDNFLKCGLLQDLGAIKDGLGKNATKSEQETAASVSTAAGADAKAATDKAKESGCAALFGSDEAGQAVAGVIKAVMGVVADAAAVDQLERINANILALALLQQSMQTAKVTVDYQDKKLLLFKARLFALLEQYRHLTRALVADLALPEGSPTQRMRDFRADSKNGKYMGVALSAYAQSWNYGRIPSDLIDFRFVQARRQFDIQLASVTAANYKATIEPITEALAAYGKGGITPDTLAEVISNLGILSGVLVD